MLEKIQRQYQNIKKQASFIENENTYAEFIKQIFSNFEENSNNETYFETLFSHITEILFQSSTIFAELKQLSTELCDQLAQTGNTIHKIANLYEKVTKITNNGLKKMGFQIDQEIIETNKNLLTGLREWGSETLSQKKFVTDNLTSFFHYKKHENLELGNLLAYKTQVTNLYKKRFQNLEQTKIKLFETKDFTKWNMDHNALPPDFSEISKVYQQIRPFILPEVN